MAGIGNNDVHRGPNKVKRFRAALNRYADADPKRLDDLAEKLWATAMSGDTQAIREVADRLDGKVPQAIGGSDELGPVGFIVTGVMRPDDTECG